MLGSSRQISFKKIPLCVEQEQGIGSVIVSEQKKGRRKGREKTIKKRHSTRMKVIDSFVQKRKTKPAQATSLNTCLDGWGVYAGTLVEEVGLKKPRPKKVGRNRGVAKATMQGKRG